MPPVNPADPTHNCVTADTLVQTDQGPQRAASLVGKPFTGLVDGREFPSTPEGFRPAGRRAVVTLETDNGNYVELTADHPVMTKEEKGPWEWKEAGSLQPRDTVRLHNHRITGRKGQTDGLRTLGKATLEQAVNAIVDDATESIWIYGQAGHARDAGDRNEANLICQQMRRAGMNPVRAASNGQDRIFFTERDLAVARLDTQQERDSQQAEDRQRLEAPRDYYPDEDRVKTITEDGKKDVYQAIIPGADGFDGNGFYLQICGTEDQTKPSATATW